MNLQQLSYFLAAVEHGSFSAAADELHLAQPSLSEQVRRLEAELGVALFSRVGRGVRPTEAGRALRPHAERVLAEVEAGRAAVAGVRELRGGTATFGVMGTAHHYGLGADLVEDFRRAHPAVRVRLVGQNSAEVVEAVSGGELEAGLVSLPIDDAGLEVRPVLHDEIVVVSADRARLRGPMTIERFAALPLVLPDASWVRTDPQRRQLAELAQRAGVAIEPAIDVEEPEDAVALAARGAGDTIAARGLLVALGARLPRRLGWTPFAEPLYNAYAVITRRGASVSPATRALIELTERRLALAAGRIAGHPARRMPRA
ncbi:MAG TPA: LysR substrate-binding domain-containing protein [Solirubrobacteraceae bacterium]|jgi:DNA-binding transcriptional LysR family regulator|nr:LysR substrate-binding domain-containing protein [Solirubrobacteraceae bacterium]